MELLVQSLALLVHSYLTAGGEGRNRTGFLTFSVHRQLSHSQPYRMTGSDNSYQIRAFIDDRQVIDYSAITHQQVA